MVAENIIIKQLSILLISAVKFLFAMPASYLLGYSYIHTFLNILAGGLIGVLFFYFAGKAVLHFFRVHFPLILRALYQITGLGRSNKREIRKAVQFNSRRNRRIIQIRNRFGYPGLIILTPVVFSIPIGTFLGVKYFSGRKNLLLMLSLSVFAWSAFLASIGHLF